MEQMVPMHIIARIRSEFPTKFGIPRQSGVIDALRSTVVFEPAYRNPHALRGLEDFTHIWLLWQFSQAVRGGWTPTVRPPRLGGNTRLGVFATRSPFRPNSIGLSSVRLEKVQMESKDGPLLHVSGADLMDGTPIFDIKPYLPYTDAHPDAAGGFAPQAVKDALDVVFPSNLLEQIPTESRDSLMAVLAQDPRPAYHHTPDRVYGLQFAGYEIKFKVCDHELTVLQAVPIARMV